MNEAAPPAMNCGYRLRRVSGPPPTSSADSVQFAGNVTWRGFQCQKSPLDLWNYAALIHWLRPEIIIECGTASGGSALFFLDMLKVVEKKPLVISIDTMNACAETKVCPARSGMMMLHGDSLASNILWEVGIIAKAVTEHEPPFLGLVSLDSDHTVEHICGELEAYSALLSPDSRIVVEDDEAGDATNYFLANHPEWQRDCGFHQMTHAGISTQALVRTSQVVPPR